jgi:hypothetical protein
VEAGNVLASARSKEAPGVVDRERARGR